MKPAPMPVAERFYMIILSLALGMLIGDTLANGITARTPLYLGSVLSCWLGIGMSVWRRRETPAASSDAQNALTQAEC